METSAAFLGRIGRVSGVCVIACSLAAAQERSPQPGSAPARLVCDEVSRIADPKLVGGAAVLDFHLEPAGSKAAVVAEVRAGGAMVRKLWSGTATGAQLHIQWDGRDSNGARCPTGAYTLRLSGPGLEPVERALDVVRLGVTEIEAQDSPAGDDESQMVYFMKGAAYAFYATPAIHEYVSLAGAGEVSDLDLDDGEPRPAPPVHGGTASPRLEDGDYATTSYNYPLAYVMGARPRLELTFGASATASDRSAMGVGLPLEGRELRVVCEQGETVAGAELVTPGGTALVDLAPLPAEVGRTELALTLRYQTRDVGEGEWHPIPGAQTIPLRVYTLLGPPVFKAGAVGTQYAGPWVEVAEDVSSWKETLGLAITDQLGLTDVFVHGFFGQNGGIPSPIEGVVYDAYPLGGDGGATHYFTGGSSNLTRLLNAHALGRFINCTDNMGATTTMMSMMGAVNMRPVRLGTMSLRALWGIGAPGYTLNLWGGGSHGFSYHHIVTDDNGVSVSDTCMQLDQDGTPTAMPCTTAWNVRRPWAGTLGYMNLSANNVVTKQLEALPGLR